MFDSISDLQIAWLAGLLEGEGTFTPTRSAKLLKNGPNKGKWSQFSQPRLQYTTTDKDVAAIVADMLHCNLLGPYSGKRSNRPSFHSKEPKDQWVVSVAGKKTIPLLNRLYPLMGTRRKEQISKAIAEHGIHYHDTKPE